MTGRLDTKDDELMIARHFALIQKEPRFDCRSDSDGQCVTRRPTVTVVRVVRTVAERVRTVPDHLARPEILGFSIIMLFVKALFPILGKDLLELDDFLKKFFCTTSCEVA